ncbi:MAG: GNAT family N-acetyltransferase [Planctomycetota bacterium]
MSKNEQDAAVRSGLRAGALLDHDHVDSTWNRAAAATAQGDPFCCRTEWALSFHEVFLPDRPVHLVESCGSVVAFCERTYHDLGRVLEPVESSWRFGCPLLGDRAVELLEAFVATLPQRLQKAPLLVSGLLPDSAVAASLWRRFHRRYDMFQLDPAVQSSASLDGGLDGWLSRRSSHFRRRLMATVRRADDRAITFERHQPRDEASALSIYDRMLAVELASWKGIGECGMAVGGSREFYRAMLLRLTRSACARVMFARHDGTDIGYVFGGIAGSVYRGQQFSYAEAFRSSSIGNLLQWEQLRWLCDEGIARYDMGPKMEYKVHWTEVETTMDSWLLQPRSVSPARSRA